MFEGRAEDIVRDISNVKQEIISYRKIIKPERSTLRLLERRVERFLPEELDVYFDDIVDAAERIWTSSTTTRRSSRRSRTRTSRSSRTARTTSCGYSRSSASRCCR